MESIKFTDFKLNIFRNLLEQSLIVDSQLMFEVTDTQMIRSCSFSATKSFMKFWTTELATFVDILPTVEQSFNMYILKGDLFKKFLSVHTADTVDFEVTLQDISGKLQASSLKITSNLTETQKLTTTFTLTTEELITNKVDDYSQVIAELKPSEDMFEFILSNTQIQEIKRLIKKLHKSSADNTAYLTFTIDSENKEIIVNDKVFNLKFEMTEELRAKLKFPENSFKFNILKSDFIIAGNQTFSIYTSEEENKVIMSARHAGAIINCLTSKITENSSLNLDSSIVDSTIDGIDELDDLPF